MTNKRSMHAKQLWFGMGCSRFSLSNFHISFVICRPASVMSLAAAAAVAAASKAEANGERRNSLGQMPKMPWVWVADQRTPSEPRD